LRFHHFIFKKNVFKKVFDCTPKELIEKDDEEWDFAFRPIFSETISFQKKLGKFSQVRK
jgi:hypothetical protein